jgi:hypothetical protein
MVRLAVVAALVFAAPAAATQPQPQQFETIGQLTGPTTVSGTWTATGVVEATGTYIETFRFAGETIHAEKVLVNSSGTIVLRTRALVVWLDACTATFRAGSWQIAEATGAYAGLRGGGTPLATSSYGNVCSGNVEVVHAGAADDD